MERISFTVQWPGKLVFGAGRLAALGDEAKSLGCRAFVATTRDSRGARADGTGAGTAGNSRPGSHPV